MVLKDRLTRMRGEKYFKLAALSISK